MPMFASTPLPDVAAIQLRLPIIFPEGLPDRLYVTRDVAARIIFVMLYIDAVEGQGHRLGPVHVYRMSDVQAALQSDADRERYRAAVNSRSYAEQAGLWMRDNSREQVRDESLRDGLCAKGAVIEDRTVPTTSGVGRYALEPEFARLFLVDATDFPAAAQVWRDRHLSPAELARLHIMRERPVGAVVCVRFPSGESRNLPSGPSSILVQAVIEEFAPRFLRRPTVLWISDSRNHVVVQDDVLMRRIGLPINQERLLPDVVLADVDPTMRLFFVEIVATDGPFTDERQRAVFAMTDAAGFPRDGVFFISVFTERGAAPLKKRFSALAQNSFVWCMAEPEMLIWLTTGRAMPLTRTDWVARTL